MNKAEKTLNTVRRMVMTKAVLAEVCGQETSGALWQKAEKGLEGLLEEYAALPKPVRRHTEGTILPAVAVYRVLLDALPEKAMYIMEEGTKRAATMVGKSYAGMIKAPFMQGVFLKVFALGAKKMFGPSAGFQNVFYRTDAKVFQMDITQCPYSRYCNELGCPELTHIFCSSDVYAYGSLPGIRFTRTQTIGSGGEKCDFLMEKM